MSEGLLQRLSQRAAQRRWARAARDVEDIDLVSLRRLRNAGRSLRTHIDRVLFHAEERLATAAMGTDRFQRPQNSDWAWRPALWRGRLGERGIARAKNNSKLGDELTLFHDCKTSELTLRQVRNLRDEDLAAFGLQMDVFRFDGSFLSLVIDLPNDAVNGLKRTHILQLDSVFELERSIEIFARLNIKHGPNTEQMVQEFPQGPGRVAVEFDLAYSELNEKRVDKAWIDLIFEGPEMNQVVLRDLTFSRRIRAAL